MTGDDLGERLERGEVTVLDVRSPEEFAGVAGHPCDRRQGHIAGAANVEWSELSAGEGRAYDAETIRLLLRERGADPDRTIVAYCHSGSDPPSP